MEIKNEIKKWERNLKLESYFKAVCYACILLTMGVFLTMFLVDVEKPSKSLGIILIFLLCSIILTRILAWIYFKLNIKKLEEIYQCCDKKVKDTNCCELLSILNISPDTCYLQLDCTEETVEIAAVSMRNECITIDTIEKSIAEKIFKTVG